jgi:GNAT superfamily N-acetyltransferase
MATPRRCTLGEECPVGGPGSWRQNRAVRRVEPVANELTRWLRAESPGPDSILGHVLETRQGRCWVDTWPEPSALLVETAGNFILRGEAAAVDPAELHPLVHGFLDAPDSFDALLDTAFPGHVRWDRVVYRLDQGRPEPDRRALDPTHPPVGGAVQDGSAVIRFLDAADGPALAAVHPDVRWVAKTWGGPSGLAASGRAVGAFVDGRLVAVAGTFFLGVRHDEIGISTEPDVRRRGLGTRCARLLTTRLTAAGRALSWTTSVDNVASRRVAERCGFEFDRHDVLHVIGVDVPPAPTNEATRRQL